MLIGIQRHLVRFPPDAGLFIAAERRMRRVDMIAVGPHATGFNAATHAIGEVGIPRPYPGAETKLGLIGDSQRFRFVLKGGHPDHRPKDLLLEGAHIVATFNQRGLNIKTIIQRRRDSRPLASGQNLPTLFPGNLNIGEDLVELLAGSLSADHGVGI